MTCDDMTLFYTEQAMAELQDDHRALRAALAEVVYHLTICPYCHRLKQGNVIKHESGCELAALLEVQ